MFTLTIVFKRIWTAKEDGLLTLIEVWAWWSNKDALYKLKTLFIANVLI